MKHTISRKMFTTDRDFEAAKAEIESFVQEPLTDDEMIAIREAAKSMIADCVAMTFMIGLSEVSKQMAKQRIENLSNALSKLKQMRVI